MRKIGKQITPYSQNRAAFSEQNYQFIIKKDEMTKTACGIKSACFLKIYKLLKCKVEAPKRKILHKIDLWLKYRIIRCAQLAIFFQKILVWL
ncbi:MAG: hypothetical protein ACLFUB_07965 [Cyclobacteriaceae bacterium]